MRNQIFYENWIFSDDEAGAGNCYLEQALPSNALGYDTLEATVRCADRGILAAFTLNSKMIWFYRGRQKGIFYVQSISRVGPREYTLSGISAVGRLSSMSHPGGIYTGQASEAVIAEICGDLPVIVKTSLQNIPVYGWLPYCKPPERSARDNLAQVLFAIGAALKTDLDGVLRVEPLWDGISNVVDRDRIYQGGSVVYETPVSAVTVTEHQYIPGGDEETLFEGAAEDGYLVTFDAPYSDLTAEGFSIQGSGANWARLSAGTGTLTGRSYTHITRILSRDVVPGAAENVKAISDCTLVSLANSTAVVNRMAAYYRCSQHVDAALLVGTEQPGQRISIYNPYDRETVSGCVASMDISISGVLKGESDVLLGFMPPQPDSTDYFDYREVLTGSGEWSPPADLTEAIEVGYILVGGASGGCSGMRGGETETVKSLSYSSSSGITGTAWSYRGYFASQGGPGGEPGEGGPGGKILRGNLTVQPGQKIAYRTGVGGDGGVYSPDASMPGSAGTDTIFGELSSADGASSETGVVDPFTGNIYGAKGASGVKGGDGSGGPDQTPPEYTTDPEANFKRGSTVTGPDGQTWGPDRLPVAHSPEDWAGADAATSDQSATLHVEASIGLSGGAAVGADGKNGLRGSAWARLNASGAPYGSVTAGIGGKGADASPPLKPAGNYGTGGTGGHGGGGAGGSGMAYSVSNGSIGTVTVSGQMRSAGPGNGSDGSPGGDGVIILFYRKYGETPSGHVVTRDRKFFFDCLGRIFVV